jgi:hypothetical protein
MTTTPPEVILDRYVKAYFPKDLYFGKLAIESVSSPTLRGFLHFIQEGMNDGLRMENPNASGGIKHPPFHFDYLDSTIRNAHAIEHDSYWFIIVTLPLVESVMDISHRLSESSAVLQAMNLDPAAFATDYLWGVLSSIQLLFLASHEYTHLVHQHSSRRARGEMWSELMPQTSVGSIDCQAEELDADGYSAYLTFASLFRSERRGRTLSELGQLHLSEVDGDELLMSCFFIAIMAYFSTSWPEKISMPFDELTHPPAPVRIDHLTQVANMWCGQFGTLDQSWFKSPRLTSLFQAAALEVDKTTQQTRDEQIALLTSVEGDKYRNRLFEAANTMRRSRVLPPESPS